MIIASFAHGSPVPLPQPAIPPRLPSWLSVGALILAGMDAVEALEQLGGTARVADIVALSSRRRLRTAGSNNVIIHVDHDRYALPVTDLGRRLAVKHNLHLTHLSAALHHGWEVRTSPSVPHLLLPSGQERPTSNARFWTYDARREDLDGYLVDPINGIILEADSWGFHADKEAHDRDCQRYTMLAADGWIVLRFTYDQVMFQPDYVLRCIEMALSQRSAAA